MKYKYPIGGALLIVVVILLLRSCSESAPKADPKAAEAAKASGIDKIPTQVIEIADVEEDPYVIGDGGTFVYIRKNALIDAEGNPVNKNIRVELKEVQTIDDFIEGRISTTANGELLTTAGSYYVNATSEGNQLSIDPKIGLNIAFPTLYDDPDIELFEGEVTASGDVNWVVTENEEIPVPKPNVKKPKNLTDTEGKYELKKVEALLDDIDRNYTKVGEQYENTEDPDSQMKWAADYIDQVRIWYKYNKYRLAVYAKQEKKYHEAYQRYLNHPKVKAWIAYNEKKVEDLQTKKTFYEYQLSKLGWWNCDRFRRDQNMIEYTGTVVYENGDPLPIVRVHLVSRKEMIHLSKVAEGGKFSFRYPAGLPFQVYATSIDREVFVDFDGENTDLGDLILAKNK